ncbi:pirin family protein [Methyloceanibacter sp.]|uniref:pirin family protein n=1 Tax=Methyloceanibacter sp. TaxID=1965321 RepID=UPI00207EF430|nr:pirin family protein [Methyloceanibacter sp.]GFO82416.1 MAG: pirin-like protein [Methyloceanibacter sp.]HML92852.1 pirin family protein [Methyloceanibacter sp.]
MIEVRPFDTLGTADHGWLKAKHHFSFARYFDPKRTNHGALRVWNDDEIAPNSGFPPHPHREMEIITYVRKGAITHDDSLGNHGRTVAGDVQVMSAGSGIRHAEYNREDETTTLFQIWIEPVAGGGTPSWGTKPFPRADRAGGFVPLASGFEGDEDALPIRAEARVLGATLKAGETAEYRMGTQRHAYLVAPDGRIDVNGVVAGPRDGIAITGETVLTVKALDDTEIVLVDSP